MKLTPTFKLYIAVFLMVVFWASAYISIRIGLAAYTPGAMALFRYLIASACMLIIYRHSFPFRRMKWADLSAIAILGILGFTIYNIALNYGELTVTAGTASFIISQVPVLITLLATIFFRNRLSLIGGCGTAISFFGILLIAVGKNDGFHLNFGVIEILIATLCGSLYTLFQKPLLERVHPVEFTSYAIWFGTLALMIYFPQLIHQIPHASLTATLAVIYNGIFPAAIAYLLWGFLSAKLSAIKAASFLYLVPIASTVMGIFILHEIPNTFSIVGSLIALLGAFLVNQNKTRALSKNEQEMSGESV